MKKILTLIAFVLITTIGFGQIHSHKGPKWSKEYSEQFRKMDSLFKVTPNDNERVRSIGFYDSVKGKVCSRIVYANGRVELMVKDSLSAINIMFDSYERDVSELMKKLDAANEVLKYVRIDGSATRNPKKFKAAGKAYQKIIGK